MLGEQHDFEAGECFLAYIYYDDKSGGKARPVVLLRDEEDDTFLACKVTSQGGNRLNKKYGYIIKDWEEVGLEKPSIIKCNTSDMRKIDEVAFYKKIGDLTSRDVKGFLVKQLKIRQMERRKERSNEYER